MKKAMTISPATPITDAMHVRREIEMYRRAQEALRDMRLQEKLRKAKVIHAREGECL